MTADGSGPDSMVEFEAERSAQLPDAPSEYLSSGSVEPAPNSAWEPLSSEWEEEPSTEMGRTTDFGEAPYSMPEADRAILIRMDGPEAGRLYCIGEKAHRIGRLSANDIILDDGDVSPECQRLLCRRG